MALAADTRGAGMEPPSIFRAHAVPPGLASPRDHDGRARRRRRPGPWPGPTLLPRARLELKGSERADVNLTVPKLLLTAALLWAFGAFFRQTSALLRFNFFPGGTALRFGTRDSRSLLQLRTRRGAYAKPQIRESIRGPERLSRHLIYCKNAPKRRSNNFLVGSRHLASGLAMKSVCPARHVTVGHQGLLRFATLSQSTQRAQSCTERRAYGPD